MKPVLIAVQRGLTLIELMIAMTLGLLLIMGAGNIFLSNQQAFRASENLAGVQENARIAFELLSREVREAGSNPCGAKVIVNGLNPSATTSIPSSWSTPVQGYDTSDYASYPVGTATGNRVSGTDAILLGSGSANSNATIVDHQVNSAQLKVSSTAHGLKSGNIVMACNSKVATIFQITNASSSNVTIVHNSGINNLDDPDNPNDTGGPGNCTKGLGVRDMSQLKCTQPLRYLEDFTGGNFVVFKEGFWYIGNNGRSVGSGRSLFRSGEEMVDNVTGMQIEYLTRGAVSYVAASGVADWNQVIAVRFNLTLETRDKIDTTQSTATTVKRNMFSSVQIRARETL